MEGRIEALATLKIGCRLHYAYTTQGHLLRCVDEDQGCTKPYTRYTYLRAE